MSPHGIFLGQDVMRRALADQPFEIRRRQRAAEMVALIFIAAGSLQKIELRRRFHSFGDHFELQAVGERDDGADDGCIFRAARRFR